MVSETASADVHWYAIYTKHQHEKKSADILSRKGFEVYLPLYSSLRLWRDRKKKLQVPLFPGYIFLRSHLNARNDILRTPGVFFIVGSAGRVCPIPDEDIESMRTITKSSASIEAHPFLRSGKYVVVQAGALAGLRGILTRVKNHHRVVVCVDVLRKAVSVEIDIRDVELLPTPMSSTAGERSQESKSGRADEVNLSSVQVYRETEIR